MEWLPAPVCASRRLPATSSPGLRTGSGTCLPVDWPTGSRFWAAVFACGASTDRGTTSPSDHPQVTLRVPSPARIPSMFQFVSSASARVDPRVQRDGMSRGYVTGNRSGDDSGDKPLRDCGWIAGPFLPIDREWSRRLQGLEWNNARPVFESKTVYRVGRIRSRSPLRVSESVRRLTSPAFV
jgi:hypothetical protein